MSKSKDDPVDIMDQYIFSFGSGAGTQWISRRGLRHLRDRYYPSIEDAIAKGDKWADAARSILSFMDAEGRLAASIALHKGRHVIHVRDVKEAIKRVEANYNKPELGAGPRPPGNWCPPPSG